MESARKIHLFLLTVDDDGQVQLHLQLHGCSSRIRTKTTTIKTAVTEVDDR
jgi:hypothetical protein